MNFRIPVWYELKLLFMAWLVLPNFRGAAFIYNKFVREQVKKHISIQAAGAGSTSNNNVTANKDKKIVSTSPKEKKSKGKLLSMVIPKKLKF
jgi:receptor expression-enhancing protein 5/6